MGNPFNPDLLRETLADLLRKPDLRPRRIGPSMSIHFLFDDDAEILGATGPELLRRGIAELQLETADELAAALEAYVALKRRVGALVKRLGLG